MRWPSGFCRCSLDLAFSAPEITKVHGVMRALIARWLALVAMLGLFALVVATSRIPCVPCGKNATL